MHVKIILGLFVLGTLCHLGQGCSCYPKSNEQKYCDADFVMKVLIRSELKNPDGDEFNSFYRIRRVFSPWKFEKAEFVSYPKRLYTASNSAMCGLDNLQKGQIYLISGRVSKSSGTMRIDLCSSIVARTPLARSVKKMRRKAPKCAA